LRKWIPCSAKREYPLKGCTLASQVSPGLDAMAERAKLSIVSPRQRLFVRFDYLALLHRERESQKMRKAGKTALKAYWVTEIP
jgi:hypothetical protein